MRLRSHLLLLSIATAAPVVVLAIVVAVVVVKQERDTLRDAAGDRVIYGQAEDQRRAYDAGFDAHLTKPVAPERLKQVMAGLG